MMTERNGMKRLAVLLLLSAAVAGAQTFGDGVHANGVTVHNPQWIISFPVWNGTSITPAQTICQFDQTTNKVHDCHFENGANIDQAIQFMREWLDDKDRQNTKLRRMFEASIDREVKWMVLQRKTEDALEAAKWLAASRKAEIDELTKAAKK